MTISRPVHAAPLHLAVVGLLTLGVFAGLARAETPTPATPSNLATLTNLQAAFNGESNAHAKYVAFAVKADEEGYHQVASLFRAAASAEKIHATNHAEVIRELGAEPRADIAPPDVGTTRKNLEAALAGESYERDTMYPEFIRAAEAEGLAKAVRSFKHAVMAEGHHAALYAEALADLEGWREGTRTFYVCAVCGETLTALPDVRCPTCKTPKGRFQVVS